MIDPNNLTTDDARDSLLRVLATLEDAFTLRDLSHDPEDDDAPEVDRILRDAGYGLHDGSHALDEIADEIVEGVFLSMDPTGFYADGWSPSRVPLGVEYLITCGGPTTRVASSLDADGNVIGLRATVAWGSEVVTWDAPGDIRARWDDVDPARAYIEH